MEDNAEKKKRRIGINKVKVKGFAIDLVFITLGCFIGAFATVGILLPNGLTSGGITGIVRILQNYVNIDFSIMYYAGSLIVLTLCAVLLGLKEARKIVLLTIIYPTVLFLMETLDIHLLSEPDIILAAIYCGVFSGICNGIVLSRGYSFGGTDTIAKIFKKKCFPHVDLSRILLVIDAIIIITSGIVYGRNIALYALITTVIVSKVIDFIVFGLQAKIVKVEIISKEYETISKYIMEELERGVTMESVVGAYTGEERRRLMTLCSPRESMLIKQFVAKLDNKALITTIQVDNIWGIGEGFQEIGKE